MEFIGLHSHLLVLHSLEHTIIILFSPAMVTLVLEAHHVLVQLDVYVCVCRY